MAGQVQPIPEGYHSVTPYLAIKGAASAIDFYIRALGAQERYRLPGPDGTIGHAEIVIGDSVIMLSDESPGMGHSSPQTLGGSPVAFAIYVPDADAAFARAVDAGASVVMPIEDRFYGDRSGTVADPFGYQWSLMTHVEDVPPEEVARRAAQYANMAPAQ